MGPGGSHWTEERKGLLWLCPATPGEREQTLGRIELASFGKLGSVVACGGCYTSEPVQS